MNDEKAKKGFWFCSIVSVVVGAILALCTYGSLLDARSLNVIGLIYILVIGIYVAFVAICARRARSSS